MRDENNIRQVSSLQPDFMGFIFYPSSKRFVGGNFEPDVLPTADGIKKVGVFVDEELAYVKRVARKFDLDYLQLHGNESVQYCLNAKQSGAKIIKAFPVDARFDFKQVTSFEASADFFLFDTKTELPGGSGKKFNWEILSKYEGSTPFFLSGGIGPEDVDEVRRVKHPQLYAIDLNSKFELSPGLKDVESLKGIKTELSYATL